MRCMAFMADEAGEGHRRPYLGGACGGALGLWRVLFGEHAGFGEQTREAAEQLV